MSDFSQQFASLPERLVQKVNGDTTEAGFLYIGQCIMDGIQAAIPDVPERLRVLDFGCGLGRVAHHLLLRAPQAELTGFDIDPMMLHWAQRLIGTERARFVHSTLGLEAASFDLIVVISVFTHLDQTTDFWLSELHRLLSPRGLAYVTYQDETLLHEMVKHGHVPELARDFELTESYVVGRGTPEGGAMMGTFYHHKAWERRVGAWFDVQKNVPRGLFGHQSYTVLAKQDVQIDPSAHRFTYMREIEKQLFELRKEKELLY
jgi:ubiquinone/menaquinone biosynthesis C-methylase UbiE